MLSASYFKWEESVICHFGKHKCASNVNIQRLVANETSRSVPSNIVHVYPAETKLLSGTKINFDKSKLALEWIKWLRVLGDNEEVRREKDAGLACFTQCAEKAHCCEPKNRSSHFGQKKLDHAQSSRMIGTRHNSTDSVPTSNLVCIKEVTIGTTFSHMINIIGKIYYTCHSSQLGRVHTYI